jgi:arginase
VADRVAEISQGGSVPLVLGGDCSLAHGVISGLQRSHPRLALAYVDGDVDMSTPATTVSGIVDAMGIAHMLDVEGAAPELAGVGVQVPLMAGGRIALIGYDPAEVTPEADRLLRDRGTHRFPGPEVRGRAAEVASEALSALTDRDGLIVHFDVDLPLGQFPHFDQGVSFDDAIDVLSGLCAAPDVLAILVTEANVDNDPGDVHVPDWPGGWRSPSDTRGTGPDHAADVPYARSRHGRAGHRAAAGSDGHEGRTTMKKARTAAVAILSAGLLAGSILGVAAQSESEAADEDAASAAPSPAAESSSEPPPVEGIVWDVVGVTTGAEIEAESSDQPEWDTLLEATGGTYDQLSQLNAYATDAETAADIGTYSAIRVAGADEEAMRQAFLDLFGQADDPDLLFQEAQIGGRDVMIMIDTPENQGVFVVIGDTAYALELPPERMAAVVEALP